MMRTFKFSIRKTAIAVLLFTFIFGTQLQLHAQDASPTIYLEITKLKKQNDDFQSMMDEIVTPFQRERIKNGTLVASVFFRVNSPRSSNPEYDYVSMEVVNDFNHLNLGQQKFMETVNGAFPNHDIPKMTERYESSHDIVDQQIFIIQDEAFPGPSGGSGESVKFVRVNHMKVSEANAREYSKMESEIFKPLHQARAKAGKMFDWTLAERIMPYGTDWDNTFMTFDQYSEWGDMAGGGMSGMFAKVHPDKNADELWKKMAGLREITRTETWEVLDVINTPTPAVTYSIINQAKGGDLPMKGQEVAWRGKIMDTNGKELFNTRDLGFDFYTTIGENPYDRYFDKGLQQMSKGSMMNMTVPVEMQDPNTLRISGGKTVVMKVEVMDIDYPKPNGAELLKKKIEKHGLSAAKEKYKKLKSSNPKGYVFREDAMNNLGYQLMNEGKRHAALFIFDLNQKNNPKSFNACDSLADGYMALGDHVMAKKCYENALKLNPDFEAARNKLSKL